MLRNTLKLVTELTLLAGDTVGVGFAGRDYVRVAVLCRAGARVRNIHGRLIASPTLSTGLQRDYENPTGCRGVTR